MEISLTFYQIITCCSILSGFIPILYSFFVITSAHKKLKWAIVIYIFIGVFTDILLNTIDYFATIKTGALATNIYELIIIIESAYIFNIILSKKILKKISSFSFSALFFLMIVNFSTHDGIYTVDSYVYAILCGLVLLFSFTYFYMLLMGEEIINLLKHPYFWTVVALLIYYGCTLFVSLFKEYLIFVNQVAYGYLWPIFSIVSVIFHLLLTRALWAMKAT